MDHPLKSLREASGCSQVEICRRTGISPTRLSLAENFLTGLTGETARNTNTIVKNHCWPHNLLPSVIDGLKARGSSQ